VKQENYAIFLKNLLLASSISIFLYKKKKTTTT
jgi:hypothetical protein